MQRRHSTSFYEAKNGITELRLWQRAKCCAAEKLSKRSEDQNIKTSFLDKVLCRPRKPSAIERINQQTAKYLDLADSNPLTTEPIIKAGIHHQRKLAVSERSKFDRDMVYETIMFYQQVTVLQEWELF